MKDRKGQREAEPDPGPTGNSAEPGSLEARTETFVAQSWTATHGRDLRFLVVFAFLMGVYYAATTTAAVKERFFPWYLTLNTDASVSVLHASGIEYVNRVNHTLNSSRGSITVERGCDAVEPTALFVSAVLASPVRMIAKVPAVIIGTLVLAVVNLVRIISLFLSAVFWRPAFDILHLDVWQAAFILLAIVMWALWASWAVRRQTRRIHATP